MGYGLDIFSLCINPAAEICNFDNLPTDCLGNCSTSSMLDSCKLTCVGLRDYNWVGICIE